MKRFFYFVLSVGIGVGGVLGYQTYYGNNSGSGGMSSEPPLVEARVLLNDPQRPVLDQEDSRGAPVSSSDEVRDGASGAVPSLVSGGLPGRTVSSQSLPRTETYTPGVPVLGGDIKVEVSSASAGLEAERAPSPLLGADVKKLASVAEEGRLALESGELERGLALYHEIFRGAREREDVNIVPVVRKLVELASGDEWAVEYHTYLAKNDPGREWKFKSALAAGQVLSTSRKAEDLRQAWSYLSVAYQASHSTQERQSVLRVLEPFLKEHIFSGRFSALVKSHTVQSGDSLARIAQKNSTTVDSLVRLNRLTTRTIQPGQRLVVLSGTVEIYINKSEYRLWLLVDGNVLMEKRVGLGRDNSTPEGAFDIDQRQKDPTWYRRGKPSVPPGDPKNILGTRWLGFKDTDEFQGFGIHGTRDNSSIGTQSSLGCVRLTNHDIEELWDFVPRRAAVHISE